MNRDVGSFDRAMLRVMYDSPDISEDAGADRQGGPKRHADTKPKQAVPHESSSQKGLTSLHLAYRLGWRGHLVD